MSSRYGYDYRPRRRRGREHFFGEMRAPRKPAHGYPVRGYHTYDLDYGSLAGPTEYSGRAGYSPDEGACPERVRPSLAEIGRAARDRREYEDRMRELESRERGMGRWPLDEGVRWERGRRGASMGGRWRDGGPMR